MTTDNNDESENKPTAVSNGPTVAVMLGKFGTVTVGLVLLMFGLSMVIPQGETGNSGMERALGALVTALGGGIVATVLLPHSLELDGKQVKPFGVDLKASGGAAVFVLSLLFTYFGAQVFGDAPSPKPTPTPSETAAPDPEPTSDSTEEPESVAPEPETNTTTQSDNPPRTSSPPENIDLTDESTDYGQSYDDIAGAQSPSGVYRFMTYCPLQCPAGPEFCPSFAWGQHVQRIPAQEIAVSYCVGAGGEPACCADNLVEF